jgi:predicted lipid carrier protein YhbT
MNIDPIVNPHSWLRLLPPPTRFAPLLALVPMRLQQRAFEQLALHTLAKAFDKGALRDIEGRRIGIEVLDLRARFVVEVLPQRLVVLDPVAAAEACVRGTLTDLLQLASRLEDADTLFFQRRLTLTGDVDLGLRVRNLLDQLPWEDIPLGLRIVLHRGAMFSAQARAAYRAGQGAASTMALVAPLRGADSARG